MGENKYKSNNIKVIGIGLFGGFFGGLLGIGGSFLVIPFLIGMLGLSPHKSHATALPVAFAAGVSALGFYIASGQINMGISIQVMIGSLAGVMLGTKGMKHVKGHTLSFLFGLFLVALAVAYLFPASAYSTAVSSSFWFTTIMAVLLGLAAGLASGIFGAGGGTILVPGLVILLQIGEHAAQGISLVAIIPTTILGTWMQYKEGNLSLSVAPFLTGSAFIGGLLGGYTAILSESAVLRILLVIALFYIGVQNVRKNYPGKKYQPGRKSKRMNIFDWK